MVDGVEGVLTTLGLLGRGGGGGSGGLDAATRRKLLARVAERCDDDATGAFAKSVFAQAPRRAGLDALLALAEARFLFPAFRGEAQAAHGIAGHARRCSLHR